MFKAFPEIKKELWGGEFWSDGGYIGTVGEGITAEIIRDHIEKQGTQEEKEGYKQLNLLEFIVPNLTFQTYSSVLQKYFYPSFCIGNSRRASHKRLPD
jgi:Transposase IS200 like